MVKMVVFVMVVKMMAVVMMDNGRRWFKWRWLWRLWYLCNNWCSLLIEDDDSGDGYNYTGDVVAAMLIPNCVGIWLVLMVLYHNIIEIFSSNYLSYSYLWGWVSDKVGRRPVLLWCNFFLGITAVAFGFAKSLEAALVIRFITGLVAGTLWWFFPFLTQGLEALFF